jgi:hypothetical protein
MVGGQNHEEYLGDVLCASFDSWQFRLRAARAGEKHANGQPIYALTDDFKEEWQHGINPERFVPEADL